MPFSAPSLEVETVLSEAPPGHAQEIQAIRFQLQTSELDDIIHSLHEQASTLFDSPMEISHRLARWMDRLRTTLENKNDKAVILPMQAASNNTEKRRVS